MNSEGDTEGGDPLFDAPLRPGYVSCIKIDGRPILPPIMTEMKRAEMRHYRELAIGVENSIRYSKKHQPERRYKVQKAMEQVPLNTTITLEDQEDDDEDDTMHVDDDASKPLQTRRQYFDDDQTDLTLTKALGKEKMEQRKEGKMDHDYRGEGVKTTSWLKPTFGALEVMKGGGDAQIIQPSQPTGMFIDERTKNVGKLDSAMETSTDAVAGNVLDSKEKAVPASGDFGAAKTEVTGKKADSNAVQTITANEENKSSIGQQQGTATKEVPQVEPSNAVNVIGEQDKTKAGIEIQQNKTIPVMPTAGPLKVPVPVIDSKHDKPVLISAETVKHFSEFDKVDAVVPKVADNLNVTKVIATIAEETEEEGISDVEQSPKFDFDDHFVVKKAHGDDNKEWDMFDGDGSSSSISEYSSAESELHSVSIMPNIGSADSQIEKNASYCPPPEEADQRSEAMSLVSLDTEEEKIRQAIILDHEDEKNGNEDIEEELEKVGECITTMDQFSEGELSDASVENYYPVNSGSGRSSTETFIIERHDPMDFDNNNDTITTRKNYFSPIRGSETNTIFAMEDAPATVKPKRYFDSPSPRMSIVATETEKLNLAKLTEMSVITSCYPSQTLDSPKLRSLPDDIHQSIMSPADIKSTTSLDTSSVSKRLLFDSPEETENSLSLSSRSVQCQTGTDMSDMSSTPFIDIADRGSIISPSKKDQPGSKYYPMTTSKIDYSMSEIEITPRSPTKPSKIPLSPSKLNSMQQPKQNNNKNSKRMTRAQIKAATEISQAKNMQVRITRSRVSAAAPLPPAPVPAPVKATEAKVVDYPIHQPLAGVNLSSLQTTMQSMSPSFFKAPSDARSPLLKGVLFIDPLFRPQRELRIPPEALDPAMQPKFCRVSAAAKGFLIRRLLRTEKIQMIIQTIRDTVEMVLKLYEEVPQLRLRGSPDVKPEDAELCRRLFQQLTGACQSFHDVFFKLTTQQRMAIIASDREKMKSKELRAYLARSIPPRVSHSMRNSVRGGKQKMNRTSISGVGSSSKRKLSTATVKSLQRRMSSLHT